MNYHVFDRALVGASAIGLLRGLLHGPNILSADRHPATCKIVQDLVDAWDGIKMAEDREEGGGTAAVAEDIIERARRHA